MSVSTASLFGGQNICLHDGGLMSSVNLDVDLPDNKLFAAVDIGSNSIHLIVARISKGALQPIQSYRERVQLAAGLSADRVLDEAAFDRGIGCLQRMGKILSEYALDKVRIVATHTIRSAKNQKEFINLAEQALGFTIDVISGAEEARIIYQGVAHALTLDQSTLVIDIGGGSTEIAVGVGFEPKAAISCAMGCVSFRDRYFSEGMGKKQFKNAKVAALQKLENRLSKIKRESWKQIYATSGTAKALEKVVRHLSEDANDGLVARMPLQLKYLKRLQQKICDNGLDYLKDASLGDDRLPLVPAGLSILITIMEELEIEELSYKDVALREGVLYELDEEMRYADIKQRTKKSLHALYQVDGEQAHRVVQSCDWIFRETLSTKLKEKLFPQRTILLNAGYLHEVGLQISAGGIQKHSAYILRNSDLPGFSRQEQELLAWLIARYRKGISLEGIDDFTHIKKNELLALLAVLRLAIIFNVSRKVVDLTSLQLSIDKKICCELPESFVSENPLVEADLFQEQRYWSAIEKSFEINITD